MTITFPATELTSTAVVDLDVRGIVAVRLVDASARDVAAVERQLGLRAQPSVDREAAVVVRFVRRLPKMPRTKLLGFGEAGYTRSDFFILRGAEKSRVRCAIDFRTIGDVCEIVCESGIGSVPLLVPIVNLSALARGYVALHGAAFEYQGQGIVVAGWAKGGKTELLLAFMSHGAAYVGDEWIYLAPGGDAAYGLPEPIKLWDWHLDDVPAVESRLTPAQRWKLRSAVAAHALAGLGTGGVGRRAAALIGRQRYVNVPPDTLFDATQRKSRGRFDRLILAGSHDSTAVRVEPVAPDEVARRMAFSLGYERLDFLSWYLKYRFAFPDRANALIDGAAALERDLLAKALDGKPAHAVYHPYPARIPDLYRAVQPLLEDRQSGFDWDAG